MLDCRVSSLGSIPGQVEVFGDFYFLKFIQLDENYEKTRLTAFAKCNLYLHFLNSALCGTYVMKPHIHNYSI